MDCLIKCCQCCLCCLEKILKFLTTNAYIEIGKEHYRLDLQNSNILILAIHGSSFCEGGKQAFKILSANALRVAAINSVGDFVLFLGKIIVIVATIVVGIELIQVGIVIFFLKLIYIKLVEKGRHITCVGPFNAFRIICLFYSSLFPFCL